MPRFQFRTDPDGLKLEVFVGVSRPFAAALMWAGVAVPPAWVATAEVDTGATITCVSAAVIAGLGLSVPVGRARNQTASAAVAVRLFEVGIGFPAGVTGGPPVVWRDELEVAEFATPLPGVDVLIGLDLLLSCRLTLDGPAGTFALEV
jgi:hypothetical protein